MSKREEEDFSIEDVEEDNDYNTDYEDEYVYGDMEEIDLDEYIKPNKEVYKGKYSHLFEEESSGEYEEEDYEESLEEKVDNKLNKILDFFESKQFTALQWSIAVGVLVLMWGLIYLASSAGQNVKDNAINQEENRSSYVAKNIAPEEYANFEADEAERLRQKEEMEEYLEEGLRSYEEQKEDLGGKPEGYTEIIDIDGVVSYLSPEEYEELLHSDDGIADSGDNEGEFDGLNVEILPSDEAIWDKISFGDLSEITPEEVYQTRGEYIYFAQRVISLKYGYEVLDSDFDSEEYILTIETNPYDEKGLPDDFEERMHFAFDSSGYGAYNEGKLEINYIVGDI